MSENTILIDFRFFSGKLLEISFLLFDYLIVIQRLPFDRGPITLRKVDAPFLQ
jgi:hypothetical protein